MPVQHGLRLSFGKIQEFVISQKRISLGLYEIIISNCVCFYINYLVSMDHLYNLSVAQLDCNP
jgi:hypothetical protein